MPYVNPIFAWHNYFYIGGTWINDPAGNPPLATNPAESVGDWLTYQKWIPSLTTTSGFEFQAGGQIKVDYFGMAGHNLRGAQIVLQYWGGSGWVNLFTPAYAEDEVFFRNFSQVTVVTPGRLRVQVTAAVGSEAIQVGVMAAGQRHEVPFPVNAPFTPPRFARKDQALWNRSESGEFLGSTLLYRGVEFDVGFDLLPEGYCTCSGAYTGWNVGLANTLDHLNAGLPCFFSWSQTSRPADVTFCALKPGSMARPRFKQSKLLALDLSLMGIAYSTFEGVSA